MSSVIERLNLWGERFLHFAWPMLWQSSLLIVVLFALDFALRRKVRASVRYALWLVVLVKLLLPPTLAAPTSIAWWVRPSPTPTPQTKQFIVTYSDSERPHTMLDMYQAFSGGAFESPGAHLSSSGWFFVGSGLISIGLLTWMMMRWRHVARMVRCASPAAEALADLVNDARRSLGLRRNVRLQLTDQPMSPAICGLFRPVILLPRSLAERLPPNQLRTVLLHELVHLKRGDVWVNCAQALLQIAYWWHPLLWLANARIRRVREEAVDDSVMLALRDDAGSYAPTLLEVAKLAFHRPLASLGLVGILESRNALRQRIERLVSFRPPRKARLTIASALGVLFFAAVAAPMGQATQKPTENFPKVSPTNATLVTRFFKVNTNDFPAAVQKRTGLKETADMAHAMENLPKLFTDIGVDLRSPKRYMFDFEHGILVVRATESDLDRIASALGVLFFAEVAVPMEKSPSTSEKQASTKDETASPNPSQKADSSTNLLTRTFKLGTNTFNKWLESAGAPPLNRTNAGAALRALFQSVSVEMSPPKTVFYSDGSGLLMVRATKQDLDRIESTIQALNTTSPQITVEAKFIEMPVQVYQELWEKLTPRTNSATSTGTAILTRTQARELTKELESKGGVEIIAAPRVTTLSGRQAQIADSPSTSSDSNSSAWTVPVAPAGTNPPVRLGTALDVIPTALADTYTIDLNVTASVDNITGNDDPGPRKVEGETQTSVPHIRLSHIRMTGQAILWDGQTLVLHSMRAASVANLAHLAEKVPVLADLPLLGKMQLVVLVTPTLTDSSGNRIHSENDMPFARKGIPPQKSR